MKAPGLAHTAMFDPLYLLFALPALVISGIAQMLVKGRFAKYSKVAPHSRMTGAEAAQRLLQHAGVPGVRIERVRGELTDHYDPRGRVLRLSEPVYDARSISAIGVACHEAGHAIQHARSYAPLGLRTALVPVVQFGSQIGVWVILAGAVLNIMGLALIGVALFSASVLFAFVTLPVEWDASARAKKLMITAGIVGPSEEQSAASVLNAAFLTYVGAAVSSIGTLLYYLVRLGLLGGRRRN